MPTITYDKEDLLRLIGKGTTEKGLVKALENLKPEVEEVNGSEITLELTPDRPDMFGIEGFARAMRSYMGITHGLEKFSVEESGLEVEVEHVAARPYVASAIVRNVKLNGALIKSLMNIQEILHDTIGKKRQYAAIGIHDYDKIAPPIRYAGASKNAKMIPLGLSKELTLHEVLKETPKGTDYGHLISSSEKYPVFIDSKGIFSLPPVINSDRTKVTEKTRTLFLDLTGTSKESVIQSLAIIVTNLAERGCKIESVKLKREKSVEVTPVLKESTIEIEREYVKQWLGLDMDTHAIENALQRMGYGTSSAGDIVIATIPAFRSDILHKVDVLEDVAIGYGYDKLEPVLPNISTNGTLEHVERKSDRMREIAIGMGFQEIIKPVLSNLDDQTKRMNLGKEDVVEISNPVSSEYSCARRWLLPSSMSFLRANRQLEHPQKIFEIGDAVEIDGKEETGTRTVRKLVMTVSDSQTGFFEIKGIFESLMKNAGIECKIAPSEHASFIRGRVAEMKIGGKSVGVFGEIHPQVLDNWGLTMPTVALEMSIEDL